MFNSTILDIAIGLAFTYLLLALICTTINEWIAGILKIRGKMLEQGIAGLLKGQRLGAGQMLDAFKGHPIIASLSQSPGSPPSYIAARTFAAAILDLVTSEKPGAIDFKDLETGINNLPDGCVKTSLLAVIQNSNRDIAQAQANIEGWFNDAMDRVSGWYTRRQQWMAVIISIILTIFVNADTLGIANKLWVNPVLRQEVVNRAEANKADIKSLITARYSDSNPKPSKPIQKTSTDADLETARKLQNQLGDITGWSGEWRHAQGSSAFAMIVLKHIPGWILTIIAVSLGAPFWFDTLNRFMNIRTAGKSPAEGAKGPRKDTSKES